MSVLTDPATYGILNSDLTNCPRTAAVLGEVAAQWQQMMETLQRVEQEAVSSQNMADAIENLSRTRSGSPGCRLRLKDRERLCPKSWSCNTPRGGLAREVAAWLGHVDPKHEARKLIQRITKGTLRATEAWTDGRYAEDDKCVELDYERAVAVANVTEGAARATVQRITQTKPSHGFVAWQALVDDYAPKSSNDPAIAHVLRRIRRKTTPQNHAVAVTTQEASDGPREHATKDPGVRGILKRSSVACHPESESQKRVALDTEQGPTPQPRVSHGGSSASGVRPGAITVADQGTSTSDAPRASSEEHNDDDVAMDGDGADDNCARHPNPSGSDTKREPREVRVEQSGTTE